MSRDPDADIPILRTLSWTDPDDRQHRIAPSAILSESRPVVVLAEPGGGKTWLLDHLARQAGTRRVSATKWQRTPHPERLLSPGAPVLIDALDEASARTDGDAIGAVLAKLEQVGSPRFVLTCRAADWQAYATTEIAQDYTRPLICQLDPIARADALAWLAATCPGADTNATFAMLDQRGLIDLTGNPLTLRMIAAVVRDHGTLPHSRAELYDMAVRQAWREENDDRATGALARLEEGVALDGAGVLCAAMLMGRHDAITTAGMALADEALSVAAVAALPGAAAARIVLGSRLFRPDAPGRLVPLHKTIAEYLGARWLARQVGRRSGKRLLARLQPAGIVPAQLRGLHAWLPHFSALLGDGAIACDPYGVLRYGEVDALPGPMARRLLDELVALAARNPWFRADDWVAHGVAGLMRDELAPAIDALIAVDDTNEHLRALLIEGLRGTVLAGRLAGTLETILFDQARFYRERHDALQALEPVRSLEWQLKTLERLRMLADADSTRIAVNLLERIGPARAGSAQTTAVLFADAGLTISAWPRRRDGRRNTITSYHRIAQKVTDGQLLDLLDQLADHAMLCFPALRRGGHSAVFELFCTLVIRALEGAAAVDTPRLWRWIAPLTRTDDDGHRLHDRLKDWFVAHDVVRRRVQAHVLFDLRSVADSATRLFEYLRDAPGLTPNVEDLTILLCTLSAMDPADPANRDDWCGLLDGWPGGAPLDPAVIAIARPFAKGDAELEVVLVRQSTTQPPPEWKVRQVARRAEGEAKRAAEFAEHRAQFRDHRDELRSGVLNEISGPAEAYLRIPSNLHAPTSRGRLVEWLGEDLAADALAGFEAALYRTDLPDPWEASRTMAGGQAWYMGWSVLAGVMERFRDGRSLDDVPRDALLLARLHESFVHLNGDDVEAIQRALADAVAATPEDFEHWQRLRIEPQLDQGSDHIEALHELVHGPRHPQVAVALLIEWSDRYPAMAHSVIERMVDGLLRLGRPDAVQVISAARGGDVLPDHDAALFWIAADWVSDFDAHAALLAGIGVRHPQLLFMIEARLGGDWPDDKRVALTDRQIGWLLAEFCPAWPYTPRSIGVSRSSDEQNASEILTGLIDRLAAGSSAAAGAAFDQLLRLPDTGYANALRHAAAQQLQVRGEATFQPVPASDLAALLADGPPEDIDELRAIVVGVLDDLQRRLRGSDSDMAVPFWNGAVPHDENYCRNRIADLITPYLEPYGIQRILERYMPAGKRADLAFACGTMQLPLEIKGQWHDEVWDAAHGQLDALYLRDWRSGDRGIYLVLWFGELPSATGRRLKVSPTGKLPQDTANMAAMLVDRVPPHRRSAIAVRVLDLTQ